MVVSVETTHQGLYSHLQITEDGRPIMRANCGDPALDWRLIRVVMDAFSRLGSTVCMADDFDRLLGQLGYRLDGDQIVKASAAGA